MIIGWAIQSGHPKLFMLIMFLPFHYSYYLDWFRLVSLKIIQFKSDLQTEPFDLMDFFSKVLAYCFFWLNFKQNSCVWKFFVTGRKFYDSQKNISGLFVVSFLNGWRILNNGKPRSLRQYFTSLVLIGSFVSPIFGRFFRSSLDFKYFFGLVGKSRCPLQPTQHKITDLNFISFWNALDVIF